MWLALYWHRLRELDHAVLSYSCCMDDSLLPLSKEKVSFNSQYLNLNWTVCCLYPLRFKGLAYHTLFYVVLNPYHLAYADTHEKANLVHTWKQVIQLASIQADVSGSRGL